MKVCALGQPYDLAGKTASLVATTAAGKLVSPCPMEVAEAGIARIMLPAALYSAVGSFSGYVEIREGDTLVDTTDSFGGRVIECADLDAEQAAEFTPLLGELQNAVAEEAKRVEAEKARAQAETERATGFAEAKQAAHAATTAANDAATKAKSAADSASDAAKSANTAAGKATNAAAKAESDVRAFVNAAGTAIGDAIAGAKADVDAAVKRSDAATAQAEAATETADAANTAATQAVGDARDAIADVKATEAKLYPAAENILVGSETGAVAHVEDAFAGAALRKITVEGACKQDGIPSPDAPKPITVVENPVVNVTGMNLFDISKIRVNDSIPYGINISVEDGRIILQGTASGIEDSNVNPSFTLGWYADNSLSGKGLSIGLFGAPSNVRAYGLRTADETQITIMTSLRNGDKVNWTIQMAVSKGESEEYKPYTSQMLTFTLPAEHPYLAKLPDGTADEIVVDKDGNVELVARVGRDSNVRNIVYVIVGKYYELRTELPAFANPASLTSASALCYAIQSGNGSSLGIYRTWTGVFVKDTSGRTKGEIQAEIDKNAPLTVFAAIPEKRYSLGKIEMPKAQDSIVNAWTDAEVTPNTGIRYVRDVNIVVANIESAIASITQG